MATIKKKIELYVSETGGTKVAKYYRIPTLSDSLPYHPDTNFYKDRVRFYAKVSGDRITYSLITKIENYTERLANTLDSKFTESLKAISPTIPSQLLNEDESNFTYFNIFDSSLGFVRNPIVQKYTINKATVFTTTNTITSDVYENVDGFVPPTWEEKESIDVVIDEINTFLGESVAYRPLVGNIVATNKRVSQLFDEMNDLTTKQGIIDISNKFSEISDSITLTEDADILYINRRAIPTGKRYEMDLKNTTSNVYITNNSTDSVLGFSKEQLLDGDKVVTITNPILDQISNGREYYSDSKIYRTVRFENPMDATKVSIRSINLTASDLLYNKLNGANFSSDYRFENNTSALVDIMKFVSEHADELVYTVDVTKAHTITRADCLSKIITVNNRDILFIKINQEMGSYRFTSNLNESESNNIQLATLNKDKTSVIYANRMENSDVVASKLNEYLNSTETIVAIFGDGNYMDYLPSNIFSIELQAMPLAPGSPE